MEIDVDTEDDLIVGLDADVTVILEDAINVLRVPSECVYKDDDGSFVYIVTDGEVAKKYITTVRDDGTYTEIEGLAEGTHVVSDPGAASHLGEEIIEEEVSE